MIPDTFQFSQGKLQDYVDCPRRFQLRYLLMQPWPALVAEPAEESQRHWDRGAAFHRLAHQYALGVDSNLLASSINDPVLEAWWRVFLHSPPAGLPDGLRRAEVTLSAPLAGYRLLAKLDLLAVSPDRFVVVDWKTVRRRPSREILRQRLQTCAYRYLAAEAGAAFRGGTAPDCGHVEMVYWFANHQGATERFAYDNGQHEADRSYLSGLSAQIAERREAIWPLTSDERCCRVCNYRSLCQRGVQAAFLEDLDEDPEFEDLEIELEQIGEIAY